MGTITICNTDEFVNDEASLNNVLSKVVAQGDSSMAKHEIIGVGAHAKPHKHPSESIIYVIRGVCETKFGDNLEESKIVQAGDILYIPANMLHEPINLGEETVECIVFRNSRADESVYVE